MTVLPRETTWRVLPFSLLSGWMLLTLCSCAGVGYRPYRGPELEVVAQRVASQVEQIREQPLQSLVQVREVEAHALETFVDERLRIGYAGERLVREARSFSRLGLYDAPRNATTESRAILLSAMVGFYDPIRDRLGLVRGAVERGRLEAELARELVLAHELTHALQDQRRDLYALMSEAIAAGSDRHLATMAVIEGEAQAVMYGYLLAGSGKQLADVDAPLGHAIYGGFDPLGVHSQPGSRQGNAMVGRLLMFPYYDGATFIQRVHEAEGWSAVDRLFADAPVLSTEQVLHPTKYLETVDYPVEVTVEAAAPAGWNSYHEDVAGELAVRTLVERYLGGEAAIIAATGWDGDRLQVHSRGSALAYVWVSLWDSNRDATEFVEAIQRTVPLRLGGAELAEGGSTGNGSLASWTTQQGALIVAREGDQVTIIEGFSSGAADALFAGLRTTRKHHPQDRDRGARDEASSRRAEQHSLGTLEADSSTEQGEHSIEGDRLRDRRHRFVLERPSSRRWHFVHTRSGSVQRARLQRLHDLDDDLLVPNRYFGVDAVRLGLPLSLEQIARQTERQLAFSLRNFKKLAADPTEFAGHPAFELQYRGGLGSTAMRFHQLIVLKDGYQYNLTAASPVTTYEQDHEDFERVFSTFRFE